ncbi:MAG: glycosyltransferase [Clostridia bacterium]|nr:glycosyltransferase [Clostridia bacterium]
MSKGTIIYYGGFTLPDKSASANRVVSNGKIFASLGYKTVFIGAARCEDCFEELRKVEGYEDMFEHSHPKSTSQWLRHMISVEHIEAVAAEYGDVCRIILYNVPMLTLLKAKKVFSKKNIEVCYDCTEWTKDTDGSLPKRLFKAFDEFFISNFAHKVADSMIAISSMMQKKYKSAKKLLILPPLIDLNNGIWHQTPEKHSNNFEFCFAGIPDGKKESLDKVVEAFLTLKNKNAHLRIIGITEADFRSIYPAFQLPKNSNGKITFMGRISHAETIKYVLGCDCYIFIRCSDKRNNAGFPTKFAESFTCGVPIITTDVSDVGEYIKKSGRGNLLESTDAKNISEAMIYQLENKTQEKTLDNTFHYENYVQQTENWLK